MSGSWPYAIAAYLAAGALYGGYLTHLLRQRRRHARGLL
jgi:hypothetical protein